MRGQIDIEAPHICGEMIDVTIYFSQRGRNPYNYDESWEHDKHCPHCGVNLERDTIFRRTVTRIADNASAIFEEPGDMYD
jgi:transcription initiation factor IIE alpha subunit